MTPRRRQRLMLVGLMLCAAGAAVAFGLNAFRQNIMLFHSPSDVAAGAVEPGRAFRVGGMVVEGSVSRADERDGQLGVRFEVTDTAESVPIVFAGILPDLFREGQGIVAMGRLDPGGTFVADEVLAKHDENYMPPEVAEALEKAGRMPGTAAGFDSVMSVEPTTEPTDEPAAAGPAAGSATLLLILLLIPRLFPERRSYHHGRSLRTDDTP